MTRTEIQKRLTDILRDQLGVTAEEVRLDAILVQDLCADSLDIVEIVMSLEEEFGIEIPDEEVEVALTVEKLLDLVASKLEGVTP